MRNALLLGLVALAVVVWAVVALWQSAPSTSLDQKNLFPDFHPEDVAAICISGAESEVNLRLGASGWEVLERENQAAKNARVLALIQSVWSLRPTQIQNVPADALGRFQLLPPESDGPQEELASRIQFSEASGRVLASLLLGKRQTRAAASGSPGVTVGRYVSAHPQEVALVTETFDEAAPSPALWLEP